MAKYDDVHSLGRSRVVPFRVGEHPSDRHYRRLSTALEMQADMERWCNIREVWVKVRNEGHHWIFSWAGRRAEWWPSSAKLVVDRKYSRGVHAHDVYQVQVELSRKWGLR